jgi:ATP-dependent DNA ligase
MAKRNNIMLCQPFEEKRLKKWNLKEVLVQPKLDGERCRAYWDYERKQWVLVSSEGNEFKRIPHIDKELQEMEVPKGFHLDGELYLHGATFNDIHSIASRRMLRHYDSSTLEYHVFDLIQSKPMAERTVDLWNFLEEGSCLKVVTTVTCLATAEDILQHMNTFVDWGYEGIIVRHPGAPYETRRSPYVMKFKPRKSDVYLIRGYSVCLDQYGEIKEDLLGRIVFSNVEDLMPWLGEYPAKTDLPSGYYGVGSGFTQEERERIWQDRDNLQGKFVEVFYQHLTPAHVPRFPIFKCFVRRNDESHDSQWT